MTTHFFERKIVQTGLIIASVVFYFALTFQKIDIVPTEDDVHLFTSLNVSLPLQKFGNLGYYLSFFVISRFVENPLVVIFLNYFFLSSTAFVVLFLALRRHLKSFQIAFILSVCFLFSDYQIFLVPKVTYLNFILLCLAIYWIDMSRSNFRNYLMVSCCILLNAYVARPEFIWFLIPVLAISFFSYFKSFPKFRQTAALLSFLVLLLVLSWLGGGFYPSGYLKETFIQHFFDNYEVWTGKHYDLADEFKQFEIIYGNFTSDYQVFTANMSLLGKHMVFNLKNTVFSVIGALKSNFYDALVGFFGSKTKYFVALLLILTVMLVDFKTTIFQFLESLKSSSKYLKFLIWLLLPVVSVVLVVYPRGHFVLLLLPFVFLILGVFLKGFRLRKIVFTNFFAPFLMIMLCLGIIMKWPLKTNHPNNVDFYKFLNDREFSKPLKMLSNDNFGYLYFSQNFDRIGWDPYSESILAKMKFDSIDVVSIYRLDLEVPATRAFVDSLHRQSGYVLIRKFEEQKRYIWVKPELADKFQ
jgi:hypothetical protein